MQSLEKAKKDFAFCSLIRTFELRSKILPLEKAKNILLFARLFVPLQRI